MEQFIGSDERQFNGANPVLEQIIIVIREGFIVQFRKNLQYPLLEGVNGDGI
ncbi:hypothetical protein [Acetonema longum]|nr:hypothetical protein [Acetonema longum]